MSRKRRTFTREFKAEAVRLVHGGREETEVGVRTDTLRNWVRHAEGRAGLAPEQIGVVGKRTDAEEESCGPSCASTSAPCVTREHESYIASYWNAIPTPGMAGRHDGAGRGPIPAPVRGAPARHEPGTAVAESGVASPPGLGRRCREWRPRSRRLQRHTPGRARPEAAELRRGL
jgi:transposase-like protein